MASASAATDFSEAAAAGAETRAAAMEEHAGADISNRVGSASDSSARVRWGLAAQSVTHNRDVARTQWQNLVDSTQTAARLRRDLQVSQTQARSEVLQKLLGELETTLDLTPADKTRVLSKLPPAGVVGGSESNV